MRSAYSLALGALLISLGGPSESVTISISVAGKEYKAHGEGQCHYAPLASFYDMRAKMWSVEYTTEEKTGITNLSLTAWRPLAGGADQMSLSLHVGAADHRINTVKKSQNVGSGTLTMTAKGDGGTFEINGKDEKGTSIKGTIQCTTFSSPPAVAG